MAIQDFRDKWGVAVTHQHKKTPNSHKQMTLKMWIVKMDEQISLPFYSQIKSTSTPATEFFMLKPSLSGEKKVPIISTVTWTYAHKWQLSRNGNYSLQPVFTIKLVASAIQVSSTCEWNTKLGNVVVISLSKINKTNVKFQDLESNHVSQSIETNTMFMNTYFCMLLSKDRLALTVKSSLWNQLRKSTIWCSRH